MPACVGRASCRTRCCNELWHDARRRVRSPSGIKTIQNTRCEPAARPTRRLILKPGRGRVSRRVAGNQSRRVQRCCRVFLETRTRRKIRKPASTARVFYSCMTIGSRPMANCEAAQICSGGQRFQEAGVVGAAPPAQNGHMRSQRLSNQRHHYRYGQQSHRSNQYVVAPAGNRSKHTQSPGNIIARHGNSGKVAASQHHYGCDSLQFNLGRM